MASRKQSRLKLLSDALNERRAIHLKAAARLLDVSEMTVRRDVGEHPDLFGYLGGHIVRAKEAEVEAPYELAKAADSHAKAKREACEHALKYIRPDETIFIDCGTTLTHLVDLIPVGMPLTAVCYALNIAEKITRKPELTLVMLGGLYHPASASFSGSVALDTLDTLGINIAFLSAAGLDLQRGASCAHFHEAQIKRKAMSRARRNILVADNSKIGKLKPAFFAETAAFEALITEDGELPMTTIPDAVPRDRSRIIEPMP